MRSDNRVAAWPSREGEFADKFNNMPKYVVSSTLEHPEWNNSTVLAALHISMSLDGAQDLERLEIAPRPLTSATSEADPATDLPELIDPLQ